MFNFRKLLPFLALVVIGIVVGIGGTLFTQYLRGPKQTVNIMGEGNMEVNADQVSLTATITNTSWSQSQAEVDNKKDAQELKDKLIALGIPESRITISSDWRMGFSDMMPVPQIYPPLPPLSGNGLKINNNQSATSNLNITLDTIKEIDKVFTAINEVPTAKINGTNYSLKNPSSYQSQVRQKALEDARKQVEVIANINHLHVGKLLSINNGYNPVPMMKGVAQMESGSASSSNTNVTYGEKTILLTATYNVSYELY